MIDVVGRNLLEMRKNNVLPLIKGEYLDIGCGTNVIAKAYSEQSGNKAVGVDVYPWEGCDEVVENTAHLSYEDASFDTISCIAALNHIPNRMEVIGEMYRLLRPSGQVIITMIPPGISRVWHKIREPWDHDQHERGMEEGEVFGFTKKEMVRMFTEKGFVLKEMQGFMLGINTIYVFEKAR